MTTAKALYNGSFFFSETKSHEFSLQFDNGFLLKVSTKRGELIEKIRFSHFGECKKFYYRYRKQYK